MAWLEQSGGMRNVYKLARSRMTKDQMRPMPSSTLSSDSLLMQYDTSELVPAATASVPAAYPRLKAADQRALEKGKRASDMLRLEIQITIRL